MNISRAMYIDSVHYLPLFAFPDTKKIKNTEVNERPTTPMFFHIFWNFLLLMLAGNLNN